MEKVLEKHNLAKLSQEAIRNLKTLFENQRNLIHNQNLPTHKKYFKPTGFQELFLYDI